MTSAENPLDTIVAFSRKLGECSDFVRHGGNPSIRAKSTDVFGDTIDVI